jgi:integrase
LRAHRAAQAAERKELGIDRSSGDLVFCRPDATPLHPDLFRQTFERRVARAGVPTIRFHDLRHTHASLLLQAGVPATVVSERLGHATVGFTLQVYAHVMPGMQADAAAAFSDLIFGAENAIRSDEIADENSETTYE